MITVVLCAFAAFQSRQSGLTSAALAPFITRNLISGAVVAMADRDHVLGIRAAGYRDIETRKKMEADTVFRMASMTKPVTAVAILMLVDEGKIRLDDPVSEYIPEFAEAWMTADQSRDRKTLVRPNRAITIRHLLTHTAGLPNWTSVEVPANGDAAVLPLALAARLYAITPLSSEPGEKWEYSSTSFNLLGRIVEVVSGKPYEEFLRDKIFRPLDMNETTFSPDSKLIGRLAKAYEPSADKHSMVAAKIPAEETPITPIHRNPGPASGLFSTASDFVRFNQMLLNRGIFKGRRLLRPETVDEMTKNQLGPDLHMSFGLGVFVNSDGSFGHNGAYGTIMTVFPHQNRIFLLLVQQPEIQRSGYNDFYQAVLNAAFKEFPTSVR